MNVLARKGLEWVLNRYYGYGGMMDSEEIKKGGREVGEDGGREKVEGEIQNMMKPKEGERLIAAKESTKPNKQKPWASQ